MPRDRRTKTHAKAMHGTTHTACGRVISRSTMTPDGEQPTCSGCANVLDQDQKDRVIGRSVV